MNTLVQRIALVTLVSGSCLLPFTANSVQARPVESPSYSKPEVRPTSYLPSYVRTSEYCESRKARFSGVWTRRGSSPVYDAVWTSDYGDKVYGVVDVVENYDGKLTFHYRAGQDSGYYQVRYDNKDAYIGTWKSDNGRYYGSVTGYIQL